VILTVTKSVLWEHFLVNPILLTHNKIITDEFAHYPFREPISAKSAAKLAGRHGKPGVYRVTSAAVRIFFRKSPIPVMETGLFLA
jgi:hypothetical protein